MNDWERILDALGRRARFGMRPGLDAMRAACAALGNPERAAPVLHVAGTNGKGTTAACLEALARAHGLKTGLATSPHLIELRERIRIDGRPVGAAAVAEAWELAGPVVEAGELTYFEATTLLAFLAFREADVDVAVVEVGLGGRLDATTVVRPDLALVTNAGLDHERHLGDTPAAIAREKAGIFKPGVPALVGEPGPPEVRAAFRAVAEKVVAPLEFVPDLVEWNVTSLEARRTRFDWASPEVRRTDLEIPVAGRAFAADAALALRAWDCWAEPSGIATDETALRRALAGLALPGRAEWRDAGGVPALLDVAHNPDAIARLVETLERLGEGPSALVVGILADKAWEAMLDALEPVVSRAWLCDLPGAPADRRLSAEAAGPGLAGRPWVEWADSVATGVSAARAEVAAGRATRIVVTGSFHTVGDALIALGAARPGEPYDPPSRVVAAGPVAAAVPAAQ